MKKLFGKDFFISQIFGNKLILNGKDVYAQWGLDGHNGLDFATPVGTPCFSPIAGKCTQSYYENGGYGHYEKVCNEDGCFLVAHLSERPLSIGDNVEQYQEIGRTGNSGFSTGPHIHLGYHPLPRDRNNGYNGYIDPLPILNLIYEEGGDINMTPDELEKVLDARLDRTDNKIENALTKLGDVLVSEIRSATTSNLKGIKPLVDGISALREELRSKEFECTVITEGGGSNNVETNGGTNSTEGSDNQAGSESSEQEVSSLSECIADLLRRLFRR
jgi:hypothetical protein